MNNAVFGKAIENVRKHKDTKLATTDKRWNQLALETNYHKIKYFSENLMAIKKLMNNPIYLGMSVLGISKTLICKFWYDYIKPKSQGRAKLCYMGTDRFVIHIKTEDFYKDIANDIQKWLDTSNYEKMITEKF